MADIKVTARFKAQRDGEAKVYRLATPKVNERSLRNIAAKLGLDPASKRGTTCSSRDKLVYTEGQLELTMYRASGGLRLRDLTRWQMDDGGPNFEMSDATAQRHAETAFKRYQWQAKDMRFLKTARLRVGEANQDKKHTGDRTIDVAVAFERLIDGIPVDGPGGKTIVYLDRHGEPTGVERLWRDLEGSEGKRRILPPEAAIEHLARHLRSKRGLIEVSEIRLGYFEYGFSQRQRILQPAYVLIGSASVPDGRARRKIVHVAPAIEQPPAQLTPPLRRKPPQAKRRARKAA